MLAGDECVATKAGKKTHGLDLHFLQPVKKSGSRAVILQLGVDQYRATALLPHLRRADASYSGRKSRQPGKKNKPSNVVTNAANLSLFMVDVSQVLMCEYRQDDPNFSILDLKAYYRGYRYITETIIILP